MSAYTLFEILLTSAVISKQRLLHENEIMQCLQKYEYQDVNQSHFRKHLEGSTNAGKTTSLKTADKFFMGRSIFSYFLLSNFYNFCSALSIFSL